MLAHLPVQGTRFQTAPSAATLLQWGVAAVCAAFFWTLTSVASRVSSSNFPVLLRNGKIVQYSSSFTLVNPTVDHLALLICTVLILATLELRIQGISYVGRTVLMLPAFMIASLTISPTILISVGAVGTVAMILYLILHSSDLLGVPPWKFLSSVLIALAASTAALYSFSGARWVLDAIDGAPPLKGWTWVPSILGLKLLNQVYWLMPLLIIVLFFSWTARLILEWWWDGLKGYIGKLSSVFDATGELGADWPATHRFPLIILLASVVGSLFVGFYPYLNGINPTSTVVGYDVNTLYYPFLKHMLGQSPLDAVSYSLTNARTSFFLLQYFLALLFGSEGLAIRVVPALLGVLLTVTTYFFVWKLAKDRLLASTAALFGVFSIQTVSAINAGLDAEWLSLSGVFVFLALLFVGLERKDTRCVALSFLASVFILFTHPWTWLATLGVVGVYSLLATARAIVIRDNTGLRFELTSMGSVLAASFAVDVVKQLLLGDLGGVQSVYGNAVGSLSLANIPTAYDSLSSNLRYFLGGSLDNSLIILLALVGVIAMPDLRGRMNRLLLSWVAVDSTVILLYQYTPFFLQARVILFAPLQVLAAMGFLSLLRYFTGLMAAGGHGDQRLVKAFMFLAYVSVFGAMLGYALENVGYVYTGI